LSGFNQFLGHFGDSSGRHAHFQAIAGIKSLKTLTVDARKQPANEDAVTAFKQARPDVEVAVSQPGDKGPPQVKKK